MLKEIDPQTFPPTGQHAPVLLAFLKPNARSRKQALAIEKAADAFGPDLRCFMVDQHLLRAGMARFRVDGVPTILCLRDGVEVDRLMGEADQETLGQFIRDCLDAYQA